MNQPVVFAVVSGPFAVGKPRAPRLRDLREGGGIAELACGHRYSDSRIIAKWESAGAPCTKCETGCAPCCACDGCSYGELVWDEAHNHKMRAEKAGNASAPCAMA